MQLQIYAIWVRISPPNVGEYAPTGRHVDLQNMKVVFYMFVDSYLEDTFGAQWNEINSPCSAQLWLGFLLPSMEIYVEMLEMRNSRSLNWQWSELEKRGEMEKCQFLLLHFPKFHIFKR